MGRKIAKGTKPLCLVVETTPRKNRLTFTPETREGRRGFRFQAIGSVAKLIAGIVPDDVSTLQRVASQIIPSWNQLVTWLQQMQSLRESIQNAA